MNWYSTFLQQRDKNIIAKLLHLKILTIFCAITIITVSSAMVSRSSYFIDLFLRIHGGDNSEINTNIAGFPSNVLKNRTTKLQFY